MAVYLLDWLGLLVRWLHVIAGIAWIGASFYFVWLDNHLRPLAAGAAADADIAGELWAVHGGGFYHAQKYRVAPPVLPPTLHWFYWEAYTTWLSGFGLLCLLYFFQAEAYLMDPGVAALSKPVAIAVALGFLAGSWILYDILCRSPLGRHEGALWGVLSVLLAAASWGLCRLYSGRGAFMIFGACLGTIMVANVFFVIIPGQRELVRAKRDGREPEAAPGLRGKQRSVHNTYFTLPVLFVMISNHYAMTYGARYNWLVLIAMSFAGACIRAWFVARHRADERGGHVPALPAVLGVATLAAIVIALAPRDRPGGRASGSGTAATASPAARVQSIFASRCVPCHSRSPTQPGFSAPPNGVVLQSLAEVRAHLPQVRQQLALRAMPVGNLTGMTDEERALVLGWADETVRRAP